MSGYRRGLPFALADASGFSGSAVRSLASGPGNLTLALNDPTDPDFVPLTALR